MSIYTRSKIQIIFQFNLKEFIGRQLSIYMVGILIIFELVENNRMIYIVPYSAFYIYMYLYVCVGVCGRVGGGQNMTVTVEITTLK